jgi:hypothetical protein
MISLIVTTEFPTHDATQSCSLLLETFKAPEEDEEAPP